MSIESILAHPGIWLGGELARNNDALPTGFPELDEMLPGGGWPIGSVTEMIVEKEGIGEISLLPPAIAADSGKDNWIIWVSPPHVPYAPALAHAGVKLKNMLVANAGKDKEAWWASEQALRAGSFVLAWLEMQDEKKMRRLQLGAESGRACCMIFSREERQRSPAALRLKIEARGNGIAVHFLKRRGLHASRPLILSIDSHAVARHPFSSAFA